MVGETACADSWGRALKTGEPSLSLPCYAERRYGGVPDEEMLMALPPSYLAKAITGMKALSKNGLRYPIAPYGIQSDVRAGMGVSYGKKVAHAGASSPAERSPACINCGRLSDDANSFNESKAPELLRGLLFSRGTSAARKNVSTCCRFSEQPCYRCRNQLLLTRWSHRAVFVGTAMRARPCRHPFFMLRFLAGHQRPD